MATRACWIFGGDKPGIVVAPEAMPRDGLDDSGVDVAGSFVLLVEFGHFQGGRFVEGNGC